MALLLQFFHYIRVLILTNGILLYCRFTYFFHNLPCSYCFWGYKVKGLRIPYFLNSEAAIQFTRLSSSFFLSIAVYGHMDVFFVYIKVIEWFFRLTKWERLQILNEQQQQHPTVLLLLPKQQYLHTLTILWYVIKMGPIHLVGTQNRF